MFAHHFTATVKHGKIEEAVRIYEDEVIPEGKDQKGFFGSYVFTDKESSRLMAISLWNSKDDILACVENGYYNRQIEKFNGYFVEPPIQNEFEVSMLFNKAR